QQRADDDGNKQGNVHHTLFSSNESAKLTTESSHDSYVTITLGQDADGKILPSNDKFVTDNPSQTICELK
ncbi:hypothetical protein MKW92_016069, partial [Papaver armeniacum]